MHTTATRCCLNALMVCGLAGALPHVARAQTLPAHNDAAGSSVQARAPERAATNAPIERTQPTQERKAETPNAQRSATAGAVGLSSRKSAGRSSAVRAYSPKSAMATGTRSQAVWNYASTHSASRPGAATGTPHALNAPGAFTVVHSKWSPSVVTTASVPSVGLGGPAAVHRGELGGPTSIRGVTKAGIDGSSQRRHF